MNIRQVPLITAEAVLYPLAAVLGILRIGPATSLVGLPLVPLA